ncbi:MAG: hypothetical protein DMG06_07490 [Acidobacteria bacterium]|nr:MAG: hypothetical protein DMG06_07490 [Acidobacteriota bacterium]
MHNGIALVMSLLALSILTLIGLTMMFVSSTETLINRNSKMKLSNLYASESASEEARGRIKTFLNSGLLSLSDPDQVVYITSNPSINPTSGDVNSNPYYDPDYSPAVAATLLSSELAQIKFAWVKIIQKTEARAGYSLDDSGGNSDIPVFFGYNKLQPNAKPSQYVNSGGKPATYIGSPVYQVTALAMDSAGYKQRVRADISGVPQPPLKAALFSKDAIVVGSDTVFVQGNDEDLTSLTNLNGLESQGSISGSMTNVAGSPLPASANSAFSYNIESLIKTLKPPTSHEIEKVAPAISKLPDGTYIGDGLNLGKIPVEGDSSQGTFADGPLNISNSTGQGILVINGDLSVTGSFIYYGLIVVKGKVSFNGGSSPGIEIHGAIISSSVSGDQSSLLSGNVKVLNNSYFVHKQFNSLPYVRLAYREIF